MRDAHRIHSARKDLLSLSTVGTKSSQIIKQAVMKSACCKEVCGTDKGTQISGGIQGNVEKDIQILNPGSNAALSLPQV